MSWNNHFGSIKGTPELHAAINTDQEGVKNAYSPIVDLAASPNLGAKTILFVLDGLYCGRKWQSYPQHFPNPPFNNRVEPYENPDWPASVLASMDGVALDSVGLDILFAQTKNNNDEQGRPRILIRANADDYLFEMAQPDHAPSGTIYKQGGKVVTSLGVHERWDSDESKRYSRNLDPVHGTGIELIYLPPGDNSPPAVGAEKPAAQVVYGCRGWVAHHNTDLWRTTAAVGEESGDPKWANWPMGGIWLCQNLWEHYAFSGDKEFLRTRAYPIMKGAAEFALDWLIEGHGDYKGYLVTAPSVSPELQYIGPDGGHYSVSIAGTMDMALIRELFTNCIAASKDLGIDADFREQLEKARTRFYPYKIGARGHLQECSKDYAEIEPNPQAPGFSCVIIHPNVLEDLTEVRSGYDSVRGKIVSDWKRDDNRITLHVVIPPNVTATIYVPAANQSSVTEGGKPADEVESLKFLRMNVSYAAYEVGSGNYTFSALLPLDIHQEAAAQ